jgi:hypothetical protein
MRAADLVKNLNTYLVRIRLPQVAGNKIHMDTTVQARTPEMARRMIRAQYGDRAVLVSQPRLIKPR